MHDALLDLGQGVAMQNMPQDTPREHKKASGRAGQAAPQPEGAGDVGRANFELKVCQASTWAAGLDIRPVQEDTAAQQHVRWTPCPADRNTLAGKEEGMEDP